MKEFSIQQINIEYSYTLPKGWVAIHTETEKDARRNIREWNKQYLSLYLQHKTSHPDQPYESRHKIHKSFYLNWRY